MQGLPNESTYEWYLVVHCVAVWDVKLRLSPQHCICKAYCSFSHMKMGSFKFKVLKPNPKRIWMAAQAERAQHDQLAISKKGLEDRYLSKTELCKKLEERAAAKAAACKDLQQQLQAATQQKDILAGQLSVLQVRLTM